MFTLETNIVECERRLDALISRELPFALRDALNATAKNVYFAERDEMQRAFDRPIPWTLNAFRIEKANSQNLVAIVHQKESAATRDYLKRQATGGPRNNTGYEGQLRLHWPTADTFGALVPGNDAEIDRFGNWNKGQMTAVMAALGAMRDRQSNQTKTSRATEKAKRERKKFRKLLGMQPPKETQARASWETAIQKADVGGRRYFVPKQGSALTPAVYSRDSSGQLRVILAMTAAAPVYPVRFEFEKVARETATRAFPEHFARAMAQSLATAR